MTKMKKSGLVMEGGAMRGMFTCGVIDVFMENDITFDGAIGVSAGAAFGCNIKSHQIGRPIRYNKKYCNDKRYASFRSWLKTGDLFNAEFCYDTMPLVLDPWDQEAFIQDPMEFWCVATDVETGKPYYRQLIKGDKEDIKWIRASASIPIFSRPVELEGGKYLDGGTADSIPLRFFEKQGYDPIVVIETQPAEYRKKPQKHMPVVRFMMRKYPNMIKTMKYRYHMYNKEKEYVQAQERRGKILVIRPKKPLNIKSVNKDPNELERVYQLGRQVALERLEDVKAFLGLEQPAPRED